MGSRGGFGLRGRLSGLDVAGLEGGDAGNVVDVASALEPSSTYIGSVAVPELDMFMSWWWCGSAFCSQQFATGRVSEEPGRNAALASASP